MAKPPWSKFTEALMRLLVGGAFLAVFLVVDWGLITLAKLTLGRGNEFVTGILDTMLVGSALGAVFLFAIHLVRVIRDYIRYF